MKTSIKLQDKELNGLLKMLDNYFLFIQQPPTSEPLKLLVHAAGIETAAKLEKKYYKSVENQKRETQFKLTNIEKAFLIIFLQGVNIKQIQPYELATRESVLYKLLYC